MYFKNLMKMKNLSSVTLFMFLHFYGSVAAPTKRIHTVESICQGEISQENRFLVKLFLNDLKIKFASLKQTAKQVQNEYNIARRLTNKALKDMTENKENSSREFLTRFTSINVTKMLIEDYERFELMQHNFELRIKTEASHLIKKRMRRILSTLQGVLHDIRICISYLRPGALAKATAATERTRLLNNANDQIRYIGDYILLSNLLRESEVVIEKYKDIQEGVRFCV